MPIPATSMRCAHEGPFAHPMALAGVLLAAVILRAAPHAANFLSRGHDLTPKYVTPISQPGFGDWQSPVATVLWARSSRSLPARPACFFDRNALLARLRHSSAEHCAEIVRTALAVSLTAFAPPAFVFVGIIWRDVLFATLWLLAAALAYSVAERRDRWRPAVQALAITLPRARAVLRLNASFAAPILAAYLLWPARFDIRRAALLMCRGHRALRPGADGVLRHALSQASKCARDPGVRPRRCHPFCQTEPVSGDLDRSRTSS